MLPDIRFRSISTLCHGALWRWASGRLFSIWRNAGGSFRKSMLHVEIFRWGVRNVAAWLLVPTASPEGSWAQTEIRGAGGCPCSALSATVRGRWPSPPLNVDLDQRGERIRATCSGINFASVLQFVWEAGWEERTSKLPRLRCKQIWNTHTGLWSAAPCSWSSG